MNSTKIYNDVVVYSNGNCAVDALGEIIPESRYFVGQADRSDGGGPRTDESVQEVRYPNLSIVVTLFHCRHFGHFITEGIGSISDLILFPNEFLKLTRNVCIITRFRAEDSKFAMDAIEFLRKLGFCVETHEHRKTIRLCFERAILPVRRIVLNQVIHEHYIKSLHKLAAELWGSSSGDNHYPKRIYLSRSKLDPNTSRRIKGEEALEKELSKYGFAIIHPQLLSLGEQITTLSRAEIVIGCIGSAFHLLMATSFETHSKTVIFFTTGKEEKTYRLQDQVMGYRSLYIDCLVPAHDCAKKGMRRDWEIPSLELALAPIRAELLVFFKEKSDTLHFSAGACFHASNSNDASDKLQSQTTQNRTSLGQVVGSQKNKRSATVKTGEDFMNHSNFLHGYFLNNSKKRLMKWVHYFDIYERHLARFRGKSPKVLELGVYGGGSLHMWRDYFGSGSQIIGVDINPDCKQHEADGIEVVIGSQADGKVIDGIFEKYGTFDIVIDDGSHRNEHQIRSFNLLYEKVSPDGLYIVEDTHTSYWPSYGGGLRRSDTFIEMAKLKIDELNSIHINNVKHGEKNLEVTNVTRSTDSISFYDSVVVFEKRPQGKRLSVITDPM